MYLNDRSKCIACFKVQEEFELIRHHVKYFPEEVAHVHYECHKIIHDPDDPRYKYLIQYEDGDSRKFYELNQEKDRDALV